MYKDINNLIMYRELGEDSILKNISDIIRDFEHGKDSDEGLINRIYIEKSGDFSVLELIMASIRICGMIILLM